ncbi:MAG: hypothetical protein A2Y38_04540 [Spirochaetes bacterium GWB1_59_5]|nr:MAG: hypothetical protein A2Y38_04540 [Spirochaetes bacterium GWB1_59_5]
MSDEATTTLRTITAHITLVQDGIDLVCDVLRRRAKMHDISKLSPAEFDGFVRINKAARDHAYGSDAYKAALNQERGTIDRHYDGNPHHPEHWDQPQEMSLFDIIEMVCDWHAAWKGYSGEKTAEAGESWSSSMAKQRKRFDALSPSQWWVIDEVAALLEKQA